MAENFEQSGPSANEPYIQPASSNPGAGDVHGQQVWPPSSSGQWGQGSMGQAGALSGPLSAVRQQIENQIGAAIDHYAGHVPGGERFTPEAKQAIAGVLDGLQRQLESEAASRLGGMTGGNAASSPDQGQGNQQSPL